MKTLKLKLVLVMCVAAVAFSCDKDDDNPTVPVYQAESPLQGYLTTTQFSQSETAVLDGGNSEYGYKFRPTVTGAITTLSVRIPEVNNNLRVTIWDVATQEPIKTETFNVSSSGTAVVKAIAPLALVKDKEYAISINTADYYTHERDNGSSAAYPITVGNIHITGYVFASGILQDFPSTVATDVYNGDVNFTFLRTL